MQNKDTILTELKNYLFCSTARLKIYLKIRIILKCILLSLSVNIFFQVAHLYFEEVQIKYTYNSFTRVKCFFNYELCLNLNFLQEILAHESFFWKLYFRFFTYFPIIEITFHRKIESANC